MYNRAKLLVMRFHETGRTSHEKKKKNSHKKYGFMRTFYPLCKDLRSIWKPGEKCWTTNNLRRQA